MDTAADVLGRVLDPAGGAAFALLARTEGAAVDSVDVLVGRVTEVAAVEDVRPGWGAVVALLPFRQLAEHGFPCRDDATPLRVLAADRVHRFDLDEVLAALPVDPVPLSGGGFTDTDADYARVVGEVRDHDLGGGVSHCLIRRDFTATVPDTSPETALRLFAALLRGAVGAEWTFAVHTGGPGAELLVGASPQRQVLVRDGVVELHPTCGTYHYPASGPDAEGLAAFLADDKEFDELGATVDAELARLCGLSPRSVRVDGPYLVPMAGLAHTACAVRARGALDPVSALAGTMFAATAIGAPTSGACRVIRDRESTGRGYYGGAIALVEAGEGGPVQVDAAALIRTAHVVPGAGGGRLRLSVGATIGPASDPAAEAAETRVKVAGVLAALRGEVGRARPGQPLPDPGAALDDLVVALSREWAIESAPVSVGSVTVVDLGDPAAATLAHLVRVLGRPVAVVPWDDHLLRDRVDRAGGTVLLGPGPGHPGDDDSRMVAVRAFAAELLRDGVHVAGVGLGFELLALAALPGARLLSRAGSAQRTTVGCLGRPVPVVVRGAFAVHVDGSPPGVEVWRQETTGEVLAVRAASWAGVRFRPESVLTVDGVAHLRFLLEPPPVGD